MNKQIEALKMAIEYLMVCHSMMATNEYSDDFYTDIQNAIDFGKEALAEAEKQEIGEVEIRQMLKEIEWCHQELEKKEWQSLSDDEILKFVSSVEEIKPQYGIILSNEWNILDFARAIEQALKEKND